MINTDKKFKALGIRLAVAAVGLALCLAVVLNCPLWATGILESVAAIFMFWEFAHNTGLVKNKLLLAAGLFAAASIPWVFYFQAHKTTFLISMFGFVFILFLLSVLSKKDFNIREIHEIGRTFFSVFVFPSFISFLVPIMNLKHGRKLVLIPFITAWCADAAAYFGGSAFGRHKLAPKISPNKTVEGMLCGIVGGMLGMSVYGVILSRFGINVKWSAFLAFGFIGSIIGVIGDLFFSSIKRKCNIKDFGKLLPGHGGVLDRFDSVIFAVPLCYLLFRQL